MKGYEAHCNYSYSNNNTNHVLIFKKKVAHQLSLTNIVILTDFMVMIIFLKISAEAEWSTIGKLALLSLLYGTRQ